jgi:putative membrane protein
VSADEALPQRLHPLAVLSGFAKSVRQMIGGFLAGGFFAFQGRIELGVLIIGGLLLATGLGLLLNWWRFTYRIGEDAVRIDSGILSRNHRTIFFDRVQDVSIAQGPLQRLVGVAQVTLETGGSSMFQEEGVLAAVALPRAEELRERVRARRAGASAADPGVAAEETEAPPLFAMDLRRVLTCGLFNFSLALFAGLFGISQTVGDLFNIDPFEREFWQPILQTSGLGRYLLDHRMSLALAGLAVLVVAGVLTGLVRTLLREWGFMLERTGKGLRRRRGLLTKTDVSLPLRRIQAGVIATGPVRDRFGWRAFKVQSLAGDRAEGSGGGTKSDHVLAPFARDGELAGIAAELGWRLPETATDWRPVAKAHIWSYLIVAAGLLLVAAAAAMLGIIVAAASRPKDVAAAALSHAEVVAGGLVTVAAIALILFVLLAGLRWLEWKRTAFAIEGSRLLIRTGWWQRRTLLIPLRNIQSVELRETGLSRKFGVASLVVDIAGGSPFGNVIPSIPRKDASLLRKQLLSQQP